jgi:hypothetical protein
MSELEMGMGSGNYFRALVLVENVGISGCIVAYAVDAFINTKSTFLFLFVAL